MLYRARVVTRLVGTSIHYLSNTDSPVSALPSEIQKHTKQDTERRRRMRASAHWERIATKWTGLPSGPRPASCEWLQDWCSAFVYTSTSSLSLPSRQQLIDI